MNFALNIFSKALYFGKFLEGCVCINCRLFAKKCKFLYRQIFIHVKYRYLRNCIIPNIKSYSCAIFDKKILNFPS